MAMALMLTTKIQRISATPLSKWSSPITARRSNKAVGESNFTMLLNDFIL